MVNLVMINISTIQMKHIYSQMYDIGRNRNET